MRGALAAVPLKRPVPLKGRGEALPGDSVGRASRSHGQRTPPPARPIAADSAFPLGSRARGPGWARKGRRDLRAGPTRLTLGYQRYSNTVGMRTMARATR